MNKFNFKIALFFYLEEILKVNDWLTSFNPKRHQRAMNRLVRELNKALEKDDLWFGRFMIRQVDSPRFIVYSDKSGAQLNVTLEFVDRCTGKTYRTYDSVNHWRKWNGAELSWKMNWFIVEYCNVWAEEFARERNFDAWREYNKNVRVK